MLLRVSLMGFPGGKDLTKNLTQIRPITHLVEFTQQNKQEVTQRILEDLQRLLDVHEEEPDSILAVEGMRSPQLRISRIVTED